MGDLGISFQRVADEIEREVSEIETSSWRDVFLQLVEEMMPNLVDLTSFSSREISLISFGRVALLSGDKHKIERMRKILVEEVL